MRICRQNDGNLLDLYKIGRYVNSGIRKSVGIDVSREGSKYIIFDSCKNYMDSSSTFPPFLRAISFMGALK